MSITRLNPDTLHKNPAFTQVAIIDPPARLIVIGGQNGVDREGHIVGADIGSQTEQAIKNMIAALAAAGASLSDVVKMTILVVQGQSLQDGFAAYQRVVPPGTPPPTVTMMFVAGLGNPDFLIEIEALAVSQPDTNQ